MSGPRAALDWRTESAALRRRRLAVCESMAGFCQANGGLHPVRVAIGAVFEASLLSASGLEPGDRGQFEFARVRPDDATFDAPLGSWIARVPVAGLGSPRFDRRFEASGEHTGAAGAFRGMRLLAAVDAVVPPERARLAEEALMVAASAAAGTTYPKGGFDVRRVGGELQIFRRLKVAVFPVGRSKIAIWKARALDRGATIGSVLRVRKPREQDFDWVTPVLGWLADPDGSSPT